MSNTSAMNTFTSPELARKADQYRLRILEMAIAGGGGHIGGSYSVIELVTALYHDIMKHDPQNPSWEGRDRLVFSKGHCCLALYTVLADLGYFPSAYLDTYYQDGGYLAGHPTFGKIPGVEATAGFREQRPTRGELELGGIEQQNRCRMAFEMANHLLKLFEARLWHRNPPGGLVEGLPGPRPGVVTERRYVVGVHVPMLWQEVHPCNPRPLSVGRTARP